jgi:hypothetical protein
MISAVKKETTNKLDCMPSLTAMDAVIAETRAAWLEGMPPVRQATVCSISLALRRFVRKSMIADLITWARNQLVMADSTMGFSIKALNDAVRTDIAIDIIGKHCPERHKSQAFPKGPWAAGLGLGALLRRSPRNACALWSGL